MKLLKYVITLLALVSFNAFALYGNCNEYKNKTGYIEKILVGIDGSEDINLAFSMIIDGKPTKYISVKKTLETHSGKGMYDLLLTAYETESKFTIERCTTNQLSGGFIIIR